MIPMGMSSASGRRRGGRRGEYGAPRDVRNGRTGPRTCCASGAASATGPDKHAPAMEPGRVRYACGSARRYGVMSRRESRKCKSKQRIGFFADVDRLSHMMYTANRIGTGAFGKVRRAAGSAQNPQKAERAEMMASTVAVVESGKAFRAAADGGRVSWSGSVKDPGRTGGARAEFLKWRRCDRLTGVADCLPERSRKSANHSPLVRSGTTGVVDGGDSARNVLPSAMAHDENMGTSLQRPQNRRERNVQDI